MAEKIRLIVVEDEDPFRELLVERFSRHEFEVNGFPTCEEALDTARKNEFDVGIVDIRMPGMNGIEFFKKMRVVQPYFEAIILTGQATIDSAIEAMKLGAYDYLAKPCKLFELEMIVRKAYEKKMLALENMRLKDRLSTHNENYTVIGESEKAQELRKVVKKVASTKTPVIIYGDPGSGKEYVARAIHQEGMSKEAPFISVNCAVLAYGILEQKLFGADEGPDVRSQGNTGWLEMADGGTIYIEDVDELHPSTQIKLLRFIETGTFQHEGGNKDCRSSARVIVASQRDLRDMVVKKDFREDLYYRLSVVSINVPALRERKEDLPAFIDQFFNENASSWQGKKLSKKALAMLLKYEWPGNIRELYNVIERSVLLSSKKTIQAKNIPISFEKKSKTNRYRHLLPLEEIEKEHILYVLSATGGNISRTAKILGVSRPKLYRKIEQYKAAKAGKPVT